MTTLHHCSKAFTRMVGESSEPDVFVFYYCSCHLMHIIMASVK